MVFKVGDLLRILDKEYSFFLQEDWDNTGFQFGNYDDPVKGILLSLDITIDAIKFAIENKLNCIITHHPLFFEKIKFLDSKSDSYRKIELLIKNKINVISIHTPLDLHSNGVNKVLADKCFLQNERQVFVEYKNGLGYGIFANIDLISCKDYIEKIKENFIQPIVFYGDIEKNIYKVAVLGDSGAFSINHAISKNVDILISSDFKYHDVQYALENNINIIDLGHYESEVIVLESLLEFLKSKNINLKISIYNNNIFKRNIF